MNGRQIGSMNGAFIRGDFDLTGVTRPGTRATIAVLISPEPHPGVPHERTVNLGTGHNGGVTAIDGPTFLATIGLDWMPAVRDSDTGDEFLNGEISYSLREVQGWLNAGGFTTTRSGHIPHSATGRRRRRRGTPS